MLLETPKRHRFPATIISHCVWLYHRFCLSFRDIEEILAKRGVVVSYETIRLWCKKFGLAFCNTLRKREPKRGDKWHLDEIITKLNGEKYILWRAVDAEGFELDVLLQKRKNKKAAIRFLKKLLGSHPVPRVMVTDKLRSYLTPIKTLCPETDHRRHKGLNNRVENAHQPTRRREKSLVKMKCPHGAQRLLSLMGRTRNLFAVAVGRYKNPVDIRRQKQAQAFKIWNEAAAEVLCA